MRSIVFLLALSLTAVASAQSRPASSAQPAAARLVTAKALPAAKPTLLKPVARPAGPVRVVPVVDIASSRTVVANSAADPALSDFAAWVKLAGLEKTLNGKGPYTVFVPENGAFGAIPAATVASLRNPKNAASLRALLSYHVVPGNFTSKNLGEIAKASGPSATFSLKTLTGQMINLQKKGNDWLVMDNKGTVGKIRRASIDQGNGTMYTIDKVLTP